MSYYFTSVVLALPFVGVYAMLAIGIVLIYRASKVLNLAHGVMATAPAYILFSLHAAGLPLALSLPLAIAGGGALGWFVERVFVRPMRSQSSSAQTVGTVVVLGFSIALMAQIWGTSSRLPVTVFPSGPEDFIAVGSSNIRYGEVGLFVTMLVVFAGLTLLFKFTDLGLLLRGAAENPRAASLMGVNPERMTALTWILGGALAGLGGILLAAVTSLQPYTLPLQALPAFLAALLGGLGSLTGALVGGAAVGLVLGLVPVLPGLQSVQGSSQLLLTVVGLVVMAARGKQLSAMGAVE